MSSIESKNSLIGRTGPGRAKYIKNSRLYRELNHYQEEGIQLWLNGKPSTSYQIADRVCEGTNYMRDYYIDCQNQVCGIGFDRIRKDNQQAVQSPCAKNLSKYEEFLKKSKIVRSKH